MEACCWRDGSRDSSVAGSGFVAAGSDTLLRDDGRVPAAAVVVVVPH